MFERSFAYETKNPDGRYRGPKNRSVMILPVQLCDACECYSPVGTVAGAQY